MKRVNVFAGAVLALALAGLLVACGDPAGRRNGTITITMPGNADAARVRSVIPPDAVLDNMLYLIIFDGPGSQPEVQAQPGQTVSISLVPGIWTITIEARYDDILVGRGTVVDVEILIGRDNNIPLPLSLVDGFFDVPNVEIGTPQFFWAGSFPPYIDSLNGLAELGIIEDFREVTFQWSRLTAGVWEVLPGETDRVLTIDANDLTPRAYRCSIDFWDSEEMVSALAAMVPFTSGGLQFLIDNAAALRLVDAGRVNLDLPAEEFEMTGAVTIDRALMLRGAVGAGTTLIRQDGHLDVMFSVPNSLTLTTQVDGSLVLDGGRVEGTTTGSLVRVSGTLDIKGNVVLQNNHATQGGGVFVGGTGTLRIQDGTIYGTDAEAEASNANTASQGAALFVAPGGTAQFGTFTGEAWTRVDDILSPRDETIVVQDGLLEGWEPYVPATTFAERILRALAAGGSHAIEVEADEDLAPITLIPGVGVTNVTIELVNNAGGATLQLSESGSMFTVRSGVTLILGDGITLQGIDNNDASLVMVEDGGTLTMNVGAEITNNISQRAASPAGGGGVIVAGTFNMMGGRIHNNHAIEGGGVFVFGGTLNLHDGAVIDNNSAAVSAGGGVYISAGEFIMHGGSVANNTAITSGGGVAVAGGTFRMNNGLIAGNTAGTEGGGVFVLHFSSFEKTGGIIFGYDEGTNSNRVLDPAGDVIPNRGHAVWAGPFQGTDAANLVNVRRRETTAGESVRLVFIGPDWDQGLAAPPDTTETSPADAWINGYTPTAGGRITITVEQITDHDWRVQWQAANEFTLSISAWDAVEFVLDDPSAYDRIEWWLEGVFQHYDEDFWLGAGENVNEVGLHELMLVVWVDGTPFSLTTIIRVVD